MFRTGVSVQRLHTVKREDVKLIVVLLTHRNVVEARILAKRLVGRACCRQRQHTAHSPQCPKALLSDPGGRRTNSQHLCVEQKRTKIWKYARRRVSVSRIQGMHVCAHAYLLRYGRVYS
jgi:hypothetical protein